MSNLWSTYNLQSTIKSLTNCLNSSFCTWPKPNTFLLSSLPCTEQGCCTHRICADRPSYPIRITVSLSGCTRVKAKCRAKSPPAITEATNGRKGPPETTYFVLVIICQTELCPGSWTASTSFPAGRTWGLRNSGTPEVTMLGSHSLM